MLDLLLSLICLATLMITRGEAGYHLEIELKTFSNADHRLANGDCCKSSSSSGGSSCRAQCDVILVFCWKNYTSESTSIAESACDARGSTDIYADGDFIRFPTGPLPTNPNRPLSNPLNRTGTSWPGGMQLFVRAVHIRGSKRSLIDHFRLREILPPGTVTDFRNISGVGNNAYIIARFSLMCMDNFYQPNCSTYCNSQDSDETGHYECDPLTGEKLCHLGYSDPINNCKSCATLTGCSQEHGYCNEPNECICHEGYSGPLCQTDLDVCGHQSPCGRGTCSNTNTNTTNGFICHCPPGYSGLRCELSTNGTSCSPPCLNGGVCTSSRVGQPVTCSCPEGYGGEDCGEDMDVCGHLAPCSNGAICNNTAANSYTCHCSPLYSGVNCQILAVSESSPALPALPVVVGSVIGFLALLAIIPFVVFCMKKKECLPNGRKVHQDPDTSHVYTEDQTRRRSLPLTGSHHPSFGSREISAEIQQQQEFTNPLYSDTGHYSTIDDAIRHRDSGIQLSSSHVSNAVDLSHNYQCLDQSDSNIDVKSLELGPSPFHPPVGDRQISFHSTPSNTSLLPPPPPPKQSLQRTTSRHNDTYSEPVDSLIPTEEDHVYHTLDHSVRPRAAVDNGGPPPPPPLLPPIPLYMVLEGSSKCPAGNPDNREVTEPSAPPMTTLPNPPDYATLSKQ